MENKWLITIDMDGTLLSGDILPGSKDEFNPLILDVYKELSARGHKVCINTGRSWAMAKDAYERIGMDTVCINANGSYIHLPGDESFKKFESYLDKDLLNEITNSKLFKEKGIIFAYSDKEQFYINVLKPESQTFKNFESTFKKTLESDNNPKFKFVVANDSEIKTMPHSIMIYLDESTDRDEVNKYFEGKEDLIYHRFYDEITDRSAMMLEISPAKASKGKGIEYVADYYNISIENTLGFGDGSNDRELIKTSKIGVAMLNATEDLKSIADDITKYNNTDGGVAKYLIEFFKLDINY